MTSGGALTGSSGSNDAQIEHARSRIGKELKGRWKLERILGIGGMAAVYEARHRNGNRVALKILHPEVGLSETMRRRFLREGYVANSIEHPGAVRVLDDDTDDDGVPFLVLELLEGQTLEHLRDKRGGVLPLYDVLDIGEQILDVLRAAHEKGVVHRDIKPENIFLLEDGKIRVLDFGIARIRETQTLATATRSGTPLGTPAYMPPEQARGRWSEVDARTDLWAVGATLFTLLSGEFVHEAGTPSEMLAAAITKPARSLAVCAPKVPRAVVEIVDKALAYERADRWPDATSFRDALREVGGSPFDEDNPFLEPIVPNPQPSKPTNLAETLAIPADVEPEAEHEAEQPPPKRNVWPVVVAGAVVALGFGLYVGVRNGESAAEPARAITTGTTAPIVEGSSIPEAAAVTSSATTPVVTSVSAAGASAVVAVQASSAALHGPAEPVRSVIASAARPRPAIVRSAAASASASARRRGPVSDDL